MKTKEDFKQAAINKSLNFWGVRDCSICGVYFGYTFEFEQVLFDSSCGCASSYPRLSSWGEVAGFYNRQTSDRVIQEMNTFWGFK